MGFSATACTDLQTAKTHNEGYFSHGGGTQKYRLSSTGSAVNATAPYKAREERKKGVS
jgi:hypothetical protein